MYIYNILLALSGTTKSPGRNAQTPAVQRFMEIVLKSTFLFLERGGFFSSVEIINISTDSDYGYRRRPGSNICLKRRPTGQGRVCCVCLSLQRLPANKFPPDLNKRLEQKINMIADWIKRPHIPSAHRNIYHKLCRHRIQRLFRSILTILTEIVYNFGDCSFLIKIIDFQSGRQVKVYIIG